jgi:hypothetical protein
MMVKKPSADLRCPVVEEHVYAERTQILETAFDKVARNDGCCKKAAEQPPTLGKGRWDFR